MAVVERENSSLPLYLPIVHQPSGDSIRQPFDCELILSLSGYYELTAYCYCCHFSVVSHDKLSACCSCAAEEVFSELRCWFHLSCRREDTMYVHTRACSSTATLFSHPRTHRWWLCFSCCRRPPVPSVIHEPSAWASAVSDVCQTGPHLSPCTSSNCILVCMLKPPLMPPQQSTVSQGTSARLSIKS